MEYIFTASNLTKKYGKCIALNQLQMNVPKGAIYGFVGRNGAGKTTLMRILSGHQNPTEGEYTLQDIRSTTPEILNARKNMGTIIETPAMYRDMTAKENMKEQFRILGIESFDTIPELLQLVGLEETGRKKTKNFSLGMRQKLGIAMALAGKPDFVVLDEPLNGLDPQGIIDLRELIMKLNREQGVTFIISSHILGELSKLATHYGFIDHGKMICEMTAEELDRACKKALLVEVTDMQAFGVVMDRFKMTYEKVSDTRARISITEQFRTTAIGTADNGTNTQSFSITQLALALHEQGCEILNCYREDENLEEFFLHMIRTEQEE